MPKACKVFVIGTDDQNEAGEETRLDELIEKRINSWLTEIQSQKGTTDLKITNLVQSQSERCITITIFYSDGKFPKRIND